MARAHPISGVCTLTHIPILASEELSVIVVVAFILDREEDTVVWARGVRRRPEAGAREVLLRIVEKGLARPAFFIAAARSASSTKHTPSS